MKSLIYMNSSEERYKNHAIIIFDGNCNLCNSFVNYCIDHDSKKYFLFATLDSKISQEFIPPDMLLPYRSNPLQGSVYLWESGRIYARSEAAFRIFSNLDSILRFISYFHYLPKFLTDSIYKWIAKNRYKMFGRTESCKMPTEELKTRFLQ